MNRFVLRSLFLVGSLVFFGSIFIAPARAANCSITTDTVVDQAYVNSGSCSAITIDGSVSTTWIGTVDLQGAGTVTVSPGATMTMGASSQMVLGATDDVSIASTATITHATSDVTGVHIEARNITVTGSINASGKGCIGGRIGSGLAGYGPDLTTGVCTVATSGYGKNNFGGAAHGGTSGANSGWPGTVQTTTYGTSTLPTFLGAGGGKGNEADGGDGGGRIHLIATGALSIDGSITANGDAGQAAGNGAGGGAGGSIYINAATLLGSGSILASGGNGSVLGGGGGGGRVAMYYGALGSFSLGNVLSAAGSGVGSGAAGTKGTTFILDRTTDDGVGNLRVTSGLDFIMGGDYARDAITIDSQARLTCGAPASLVIAGTTVQMNDVSFSCASTLTSLVVSSTQPLQMSSSTISFTGAIASALFTGGDGIYSTSTTLTLSDTDVVIFGATSTWQNTSSTISVTKTGSHAIFQVPLSSTFTNFSFTGASSAADMGTGLSFTDGVTLGLVGSSIYANVSSTFNSLSIDATSSINASGKGCIGGRIGSGLAGYGPDLTTGVCTVATSGYGKNNFGGAAHAGTGGANSSWPGTTQTTTYGSSTFPVLFGSGGGKGNEADGGNGGGRLHLTVTGTLTIEGSITANGDAGQAVGNGAGGGAGGSIYINAAGLSGSGSILASGGNGAVHGGGGGGGRVAVYYGGLGSFSLSNVLSSAGAGAGAGTAGTDGTVYTVQTNVAPDMPTLLGQSSLVDGSTTSTATPTFSFTLSDPDVANTVKYQIQIDDSADFGSPTIDYTGALAAQGIQTFQVGQAAGSGSYVSGQDAATLSNGSYYWKVKAIDASGAVSSYVIARGGSIAFVIDTTPRYLSFESVTGSGLESVTATSIRVLLDIAHFENVTTTYSIITASTTAEGAGTDYTLATGEAVITAGETSTTIALLIVNDRIDESNETIGIELSSPIHAIIGSNTSTLYTILDNDTAGVTITPTAVSVTEGLTTDTYQVVLDSQPTSTVRITFATSTNGVTLDATYLDFTSSNWETPQSVLVTATDDLVAESTHTSPVSHTASVLAGYALGYSGGGLSISDVTATITDNDSAGVSISKASASVTEGGNTDGYTVVLTTAPTSTVTITFTLSDDQTALSASTMTFTALNWSTPQTIAVTAANDQGFEFTKTMTITHTASSDGIGYISGLSIDSVTVTVLDNDDAGGGGAGAGAGMPVFIPLVPTPIPVEPIEPIKPIVNLVPQEIMPLIETILNPSDVMSLVESTGKPRDTVAENTHASLIKEDTKALKVTASENDIANLANFVTYGISKDTVALGSGERKAVVKDAIQTMGTAKIHPADLERMTRGVIPQFRNRTIELQQLSRVRQTFASIYGRDPNFKNAEENLAWNTLMYRIRFPRDLKTEMNGIKEFKSLFGKDPKDPFQWATVRVMGYVNR